MPVLLFQVTYESVLVPGDTSLLVGVGVGVAVGLASLAAEQTVQVGADLVRATALDSVALSAAGLCLLASFMENPLYCRTHLEELGTLGRVTWSEERISDLAGRSGCGGLRLLDGFFSCFLRLARGLELGLAHVDDLQQAEDVEGSHGGAGAESLEMEWKWIAVALVESGL